MIKSFKNNFVRIFGLTALTTGVAYIGFRISDLILCYEFMLGRRIESWHSFEGVFPFLVFGLEVTFIAELGLFLFANWKTPVSPNKMSLSDLPEREWPYITILIPTYDEPIAVVESTLRAAVSIDYPTGKFQILLLDDQGSQIKEELIDTLNREFPNSSLKYASRIKEGLLRDGFKAGNLNFGMNKAPQETKGFLLLDADHACLPHILKELVPYARQGTDSNYFHWDSQFGFAQAPQTYVMGSIDIWDRPSREFQMITQAYRGAQNAVMLAGCSALINAEAIKQVGGFDTGTVTEDLATGAKLHGRGYVSYFHPNPVANGLVPDTLLDIFRQRLRWAQGSFQFLKKFFDFTREMNFRQKLVYFSGVSQFLMAFPYLALALLPPLIILKRLDASLFYSTPSLLFLGLFIALRYCCRESYCRKTFPEKVAGTYLPLLYAPVYIGAFFLAFLKQSILFWTTPKSPAPRHSATMEDRIATLGFLWIPISVGFLNAAGFVSLTRSAWLGQYPLSNFILDYSGLLLLSLYFSICGLCAIGIERRRD